ncbi:metallophosphoesterase [Phenylobacterium montanum]|uniref:Metallophosphoesterase n=1 Tax=Phenylobacterium montanum TaxID=2823693 RepID=A0A975G4P1_9CAUL|nr:metallophosphoesterase [Caulobacter sp. S6]QUD90591.1 metallophosphoesterase [Caulobacter sp. S6]
MLLLHISDIHFREPDCLDADTDPDHPIRTRISNHLKTKVDEFGPVDAILVGGDIAYKAHPDEYAVATQWLAELANICGCSSTNRVFVVPGNHDVDRSITGKNLGLQNAQHRIANARLDNKEQALRAQLRSDQVARDLFAAHAAYNDFAAPMNCQIYPTKIFWHQDLPLGGGVMLRINGLTSTLLSGKDGADDREGDLFLSAMQTALDPVEDRVHLTLCHHPVEWLSDGDQVDDDLNSRAMFQLFGHKHRQRIVPTPHYIRVLAGSVNPSRKEPGWEPGYNLLRIDVEGVGAARQLRVETHQFRYQRSPEMFVPVQTPSRQDAHRATMPFPGRLHPAGSPAPTLAAGGAIADSSTLLADLAPAQVIDVEASMGDELRRDLIHRFWQLDGDRKREVMFSLALITEDELSLPEPERYGMAFLRAGERGQLDQLAELVATAGGN